MTVVNKAVAIDLSGTAYPETQTQPGVVAAAILTPVVVILAIALAVFVYLWRKGKKTGAGKIVFWCNMASSGIIRWLLV